MPYTKEQREKNKSILLATLNYLLEFHSGDMVFDEYSPSKQWYLSDLKKTETDIKNSRSKQIERRLDMHISLLRNIYDLGLNKYIKENTGYDIDIYEEYKANVQPILLKGEISHNDVYLVEKYVQAYQSEPDEEGNVGVLKALLAEREAEINRSVSSGECIIVHGSEMFHSNGKAMSAADYLKFTKKWLLYEVIAPNGTNKLSVQISGKGDYSLTYVNISFDGGVGGIYGAIGEKLPLKVYWKDDHNVIIETKREYETSFKYSKVSRYGKEVRIEYLFK